MDEEWVGGVSVSWDGKKECCVEDNEIEEVRSFLFCGKKGVVFCYGHRTPCW